MKDINWKIRLKNKLFWLSIIPALVLLIKAGAAIFGFTLELDELGDNLLAIVDAVFVILAVLGIVVDPTTSGVSDSEQALTYDTPKKGSEL